MWLYCTIGLNLEAITYFGATLTNLQSWHWNIKQFPKTWTGRNILYKIIWLMPHGSPPQAKILRDLARENTFPLTNPSILQFKIRGNQPAAGSPANGDCCFPLYIIIYFFARGLPFSIRNFYIRAEQIRGKSMRARTRKSFSVADGLSGV